MADTTSSQSSGITGSHLLGFVEQEEISNLELLEKEPTSAKWTDEKHSLYIKSIENSFVQQLYSSIDLSGLYPHMKKSSQVKSSKRNEFQEDDQRIQYGRGEPPSQKRRKCHHLLQNLWIQHFSSGDRQIIQDNASRGIYCTLANISDDFPVCPAIGDSSDGEEFSDQNFGEDEDEEITCSLRPKQRLKNFETVAENEE